MERTALITGAAGGLGAAVAEAFLHDGWRVVAPVRDASAGERLPAHERLRAVEADLLDEGSVARAVVAAAADPQAPLRAVVNLVGGFAMGGRVHQTPVADFERMLALNLRPTYLVTAAALTHLMAAGGGAIVCVSARAAVRPFPGAAGYVAAKAALLAFTEALAAEYRDDAIRANAVLPSVIDTPANRAAMPDAEHGRWVAPERIAGVVRFLCSPEADVVSGAAVPVYGRA
jgi:NAD(P)-dependent dehydrogenase (short-subunit alcohol dehydrogenase family)